MALPQDGVNANKLSKVSTIPTGKELIFIDPTTNEGGVITLEDLTKQILQNLTSQTFALDQGTKTLPAALNELNSKTKIGDIRYISCGGYGALAVFTVGKLLYCKFNGNDKNSQSVQTNVAQLPDEYILNDSIGVYRAALIGGANTNIGNIQIKADGNIDMYCPYPYLYGIVIIPTK